MFYNNNGNLFVSYNNNNRLTDLKVFGQVLASAVVVAILAVIFACKLNLSPFAKKKHNIEA